MHVRILLIFNLVLFVNAAEIVKDDCASSRSCHDCIQKPDCVWNFDKDVTEDADRCLSLSNPTVLKTKSNVLYNPSSSVIAMRNKPIDEEILVSPQELSANLRIRSPLYFLINLDKSDSIAPPHFENIIVEFIRKQPNKILARIEALYCPSDISKHHQVLTLNSYQTNQTISLEVNLQCTCTFSASDNSIL